MKIKRTWITKSGEKREKVYDYDKKSSSTIKSSYTLLVGKKHGKYDNRVKEFLDSVDDPALRARYESKIKLADAKNERLTVKSLLSKVERSKVRKLLINAGVSEEDIEEEYGIDSSELLDESNWEGETFTSKKSGKQFKFNWGYTGNIFEEVLQ